MNNVRIEQVTTNKQKRQFIDFSWSLYRQDPLWIPPLVNNQRQLLGWKKHPFYDNAESQSFLAFRGDRMIGRITAILNREHNRIHSEKRGFWGFFECEDDVEAAQALFAATKEWLAERDIHALRGPANPSMNYETGLLVDGFDESPVFMMTYNPPYYARLVEACGFAKSQDLFAFVGYKEQLDEVDARLGPIAKQAAERCNAVTRPMNHKKFREEVELFLNLYNSSMEGCWGFVPFTSSEIQALAGEMKFLMIPELTYFAEVDGRAVGTVVVMPDYNPIIKKINGCLFPFGFIRLLLSKRRKFPMIRIMAANVTPEYQRWGLGLVLLRSIVPKILEIGLERAEFSWVLESNDLSRMGLEKGGAKIYKTYRMYDSVE